ncbi:hypothetical protein [Capnocytophaga cynodegmi]|uniref:Lipoprotein n=1 Tax=Capnocytophaga cynodegmi TaxID=28189 RepID=A0A0B7HAJ4_9FLAO|nr:hypothetical protein [Capnocytophaga cynodegmi]GIM55325.1 hypothetical protein CAPN005_19720 [Capnocytophaga cynodegmi]CEN35559.1 exported hypothetical protein [Capnocytophaga cynodegmi]
MKKIYLLAIVIGMVASSCNLDRTPYDGLPEEQQLSSVQGFEVPMEGSEGMDFMKRQGI